MKKENRTREKRAETGNETGVDRLWGLERPCANWMMRIGLIG